MTDYVTDRDAVTKILQRFHKTKPAQDRIIITHDGETYDCPFFLFDVYGEGYDEDKYLLIAYVDDKDENAEIFRFGVSKEPQIIYRGYHMGFCRYYYCEELANADNYEREGDHCLYEHDILFQHVKLTGDFGVVLREYKALLDERKYPNGPHNQTTT